MLQSQPSATTTTTFLGAAPTLPRPAAPPPREMWRGGTRARVPVKCGGERQIKTLPSLKSSPAFPGNICT